MHKLKKLQERFKKGELTKAQYDAEVAKLLTDDYIDQDEHDEALKFDPEEEKPIYTQADVDAMITSKAVKMVRKELKDAGITVEGSNKELIGKVVALAKTGQAGDGKATDQDLAKLKALETKVPGLEAQVKDLSITNAVLAAASKYNPYNPSQVVRALKLDYMDELEINEETGKLDPKALDRVLKRVKESEPNLFKEVGDEQDPTPGNAGGFRSKTPGGAGYTDPKDKAYQDKLAQAREMLNLPNKTK